MAKSFPVLVLLGSLMFHLQGCGGGAATTAAPDTTVAPTTKAPAQTVKSSLGFKGVTETQARAMEPSVIAGIAETMGADVEAADVSVTGYATTQVAAGNGRRLGAHMVDLVTVDFEVEVPDGVDASTVSDAVTAAAADSTALITAIKAAIAADPAVVLALSDLGLDDLADLVVSVAAPTVVTEGVTTPTPSVTVEAGDVDAIAAACTVELCPADNSTRRLGAHEVDEVNATCSACAAACASGATCSDTAVAAANSASCATYALCAILSGPLPTSDVTVVEAPAGIAEKCTADLCPGGFADVATTECGPCALACSGAAACADTQTAAANAVACATYTSCSVISPTSRRLSFDLVI